MGESIQELNPEMTFLPDLHSFLDGVRKDRPDLMLEFEMEVPVDHTSTAVALNLEKQGQHPMLYFKQLQGSPFGMVANLFGSEEFMAYSIGVEKDRFNDRFGDCLDNLIKAAHVPIGPVQDVVWEGEAADVTKLPVPRHFIDDAGPYITAGMVASHDPDTSVCNLAYARFQVKGPRRMGVSLHSRQHLWDHHRRAALAGKDLPAAVVIGAHPAVMIAAAAKMGIDQSEYDLAGALIGTPLAVCKARTVDLNIPAHAEIVIEGRILADQLETEGPFGEYTGYTSGRSTDNIFEVSAVTLRKDAIFVDIIPGNSAEHLILGGASKRAWIHKRMKEALPFYLDCHFPHSGTHFHSFIRIDKTAEGQAKQAAQLLMGLDHYVKLVVVVDKDIDIRRESEVLWAMATRMQADEDVEILSGVLVNRLDPSSHDGLGAKMIIDATAPMGMSATPVLLPEEANQLARRLLLTFTEVSQDKQHKHSQGLA